MQYLKKSLVNTFDFLMGTKNYFRDVLLANIFILFLLIPGLANLTRIILKRGNIAYLSNDNIGEILTQHPYVLAALLGILLLLLVSIFFEFSFLLISMYFIRLREPITVQQLLKMTIIQLKKIRPITILFFLFYFFLVLPFVGWGFNSDLLSRIKIPAFIMDYIFTNRVIIISLVLLGYLILLYLGIRLVFALPEMILRDRSFRHAVKESWQITKARFFAILGQFFLIAVVLLLLSSLLSILLLALQKAVETYAAEYALISAVLIMALLQITLVTNIVLSTIGFFYVIIDFMDDEKILPEIPHWFKKEPLKERKIAVPLLVVFSALFGIGIALYNVQYLQSDASSVPLTISHRGVSEKNAAQNTIAALEKTAKKFAPDYVEMDIQETKDQQFVVMHDFNLKNLTGVDKRPNELTLKELTSLSVKEDGHEAPIASFDAYLAAAEALQQKLLIEIKTTPQDSADLTDRFLDRYKDTILKNGYEVQSLDYYLVEALKKAAPEITVGYILPFNVVGPPTSSADFLTMEYSTINQNFITSAKESGHEVYVWTVNDADSVSRMRFYGVDGIITDDLTMLDTALAEDDTIYSNKLLNFVIGLG